MGCFMVTCGDMINDDRIRVWVGVLFGHAYNYIAMRIELIILLLVL